MKVPSKVPVLLEVCANSVSSALAAQEGGAVRVELCENLNEGGTTPSYAAIARARELLKIKLYVLIRPRCGDFLYTDLEYEIMLADAKHCLEAGCDGIVTGILNADGSIDKARSKPFADMAKLFNAGATFHRAFDMCNDQFKALDEIVEMGFERILTSGYKTTAMEGSRRIAELIKKAGDRIIIMPGSGINENNVADLVNFTGATEVHSSARARIDSKMAYKNNQIIMGSKYGDDYCIDETTVEHVKALITNANDTYGQVARLAVLKKDQKNNLYAYK